MYDISFLKSPEVSTRRLQITLKIERTLNDGLEDAVLVSSSCSESPGSRPGAHVKEIDAHRTDLSSWKILQLTSPRRACFCGILVDGMP